MNTTTREPHRAAPLDRRTTWNTLTTPGPAIPGFDPAAHPDLPAPARRLLTGAVPTDGPIPGAIQLEMRGEIKLKRWMPFSAHQVIRIGRGFVWNAEVGRFPMQFRGGDAALDAAASLEFRLWRLIPVVRASGIDIARSAAGRLAAETAAWAPQGLTPGAGATWSPVDAMHAEVAVPTGIEPTNVTLGVDAAGEISTVEMQRWGDPAPHEFGLHPFGGQLHGTLDCEGLRVARAGEIGWFWGTDRQSEGIFFRFEIVGARPLR